ncbi:MAG TPA: hypothetical protein GX702_06440 [Chloroflexi bacterium]|jgi:hypothetical protein|nr:hypothetical protein [Chloroflexota bacterium]
MHSTHSLSGKRFVVVLIVVIVIGGLFTTWAARRADRQLRQNILLQARQIAEGIPPETIEALSGTSADLVAPQYLHLKEQFIQTQQLFPTYRFLYLIGQRSNGTIFIHIDSEPPRI